MTWADDAFGVMPDRPDTPTFWKLIGMINQLDGAVTEAVDADAAHEAFEKAFEGLPALDELSYVGMQRGMRAMGITSRAQVEMSKTTLMRMASLWMEAFAMGAKYQRETS